MTREGVPDGRRLLASLALAVGLLTPHPLVGQEAPERFAGDWSGVLEAPGARYPLVFHLQARAEGYSATLDSPNQGAFGIPADSVTTDEDSLVIEFASLGGRYEAELSADGGRLAGSWTQAGTTLALNLARDADLAEGPARPQHSEPPFPYVVEEILFDGGDEGVRLAGTLTRPDATGPHPAAVLVSGSGPQDRDETIFGHKPFLVLADYLTRRGIAVLRYDDRGIAGSSGDFSSATTEEFTSDARAAVEYLAGRAEIDGDAIGVIGHSEGGLVAQLLATRTPLAFIVTIAGPGLPGDSVLALQVDALNRAGGMSDAVRRSNNQLQRRLMDIAKSDLPTDSARREVEAVFAEAAPGLPMEQVRRQAAVLTSPWMRGFLRYDPRPTLRRLTLPVLAIVGSKDLQVLPEPNLEATAAALDEANNPSYEVIELEGLNHLLQPSETGAVSEYGRIEETIAPVALETIGDWIAARVGRTTE